MCFINTILTSQKLVNLQTSVEIITLEVYAFVKRIMQFRIPLKYKSNPAQDLLIIEASYIVTAFSCCFDTMSTDRRAGTHLCHVAVWRVRHKTTELHYRTLVWRLLTNKDDTVNGTEIKRCYTAIYRTSRKTISINIFVSVLRIRSHYSFSFVSACSLVSSDCVHVCYWLCSVLYDACKKNRQNLHPLFWLVFLTLEN